jgi:hypothetical protein
MSEDAEPGAAREAARPFRANTAASPPAIGRRALLGGSAALGIASLVLPGATAAASVLTAPFACTGVVPFIAQGGTATVESITVTATSNSASDAGSNRYLHQSLSKILTVLTFSPSVTGLQVRTTNHADGVSERYTFTWSLGGSTRLTAFIENEDTTRAYSVPGGFDELRIDYTFPAGALNNTYGSYLELFLPC